MDIIDTPEGPMQVMTAQAEQVMKNLETDKAFARDKARLVALENCSVQQEGKHAALELHGQQVDLDRPRSCNDELWTPSLLSLPLPGEKEVLERYKYHVGEESAIPASASSSSTTQAKSKVVALNCSCVKIGHSEKVTQVAAVDVLTGKVILHAALCDIRLGSRLFEQTWEEICRSSMEQVGVGQSMRTAFLNFLDCIDQDTILVMHGGYEFLPHFRMAHGNIIDTQILAEEVVGKSKSKPESESLGAEMVDCSLKACAERLAGVRLQALEREILCQGEESTAASADGSPSSHLYDDAPPQTVIGQLGYDYMEAARATREVLIRWDKAKLEAKVVKK
ncbi:hypothetical protein BDV19DRAFT_388168 [Aspergillus venezuelensis]